MINLAKIHDKVTSVLKKRKEIYDIRKKYHKLTRKCQFAVCIIRKLCDYDLNVLLCVKKKIFKGRKRKIPGSKVVDE